MAIVISLQKNSISFPSLGWYSFCIFILMWQRVKERHALNKQKSYVWICPYNEGNLSSFWLYWSKKFLWEWTQGSLGTSHLSFCVAEFTWGQLGLVQEVTKDRCTHDSPSGWYREMHYKGALASTGRCGDGDGVFYSLSPYEGGQPPGAAFGKNLSKR